MHRTGIVVLLLAPLTIATTSVASAAGEVVVVFELESRGAGLKAEALARLTDYVGAELARAGFKIVPPQALKRALGAQKAESYKQCYQESCQIEVGKELAAEKTLAGSISKLGSRCIVALKLHDLRTSTQESAGTAKGKCDEDGVVDSTDAALKQLTGLAPRPRAAVASPVQGADYGDLDAEVRAASKDAEKAEATRKAREVAAGNDWVKIEPVVRGAKLPKERRIAILEKFLATFEGVAPYADEAHATLAALRSDGEMVVVPGGDFFMGCNPSADSECDADEKPGRTVRLRAFAIDRSEVTAGAYEKCVAAGACTDSMYLGSSSVRITCTYGYAGRSNFPMNCVRWSGADAYCRWAKKRLPTEEEWEKAARGTDGRKYPWGNEGYGRRRVANVADVNISPDHHWRSTHYDDGYAFLAPIGSFPEGASPYGALDMMGNVSEWIGAGAPPPVSQSFRGGGFNNRASDARASSRLGHELTYYTDNVGFRCARSR